MICSWDVIITVRHSDGTEEALTVLGLMETHGPGRPLLCVEVAPPSMRADLQSALLGHLRECTALCVQIDGELKKRARPVPDGLGDVRCVKCGRYHYDGQTACETW